MKARKVESEKSEKYYVQRHSKVSEWLSKMAHRTHKTHRTQISKTVVRNDTPKCRSRTAVRRVMPAAWAGPGCVSKMRVGGVQNAAMDFSMPTAESVPHGVSQTGERKYRLKIIVLQVDFFFARNKLSNRTGSTAQVQKSQPATAVNRRKYL